MRLTQFDIFKTFIIICWHLLASARILVSKSGKPVEEKLLGTQYVERGPDASSGRSGGFWAGISPAVLNSSLDLLNKATWVRNMHTEFVNWLVGNCYKSLQRKFIGLRQQKDYLELFEEGLNDLDVVL